MKASRGHAGLALILGVAGLALMAGPARAAPDQSAGASPAEQVATPFVAPAAPMILSRTLRRPLPGGADFIATRSYEIRFVREGEGHRIDGRLVEVDVKAPASLSAFAEIERNRPDTGMFPLRLDAAGMLLPVAGSPSGSEVRSATELVLARLGERQMPALDMLEAQAFAQRIGQRPTMSQWPADVLRPLATSSSRSSPVPLPGGVTGQITIEIAASTQGGSGLMREMTRTVTSDLGGDLRRTIETWTLTAVRD